MPAELRTTTAPHGRRLEYLTDGPPTGRLLVFHHGTPAGPVLVGSIAKAAAAGARWFRQRLSRRPAAAAR